MECEIIVDNSLVICLKEHIYDDKTVADRNSIYRNAAAVPLLAVMIQTKKWANRTNNSNQHYPYILCLDEE